MTALHPAIRTLAAAALVASLGLAVAACDETVPTATGAFGGPIDFSYACEGDGATVAPANDERADFFSLTRMCDDVVVTSGGAVAEGHLLGLVLNDTPPGVNLVQMNPASSGGRRVLDTDAFLPGFTSILVGDNPVRIVRAPDWGSFFVLSAGGRDVTRIVVKGVQGPDGLQVETARFDLPGPPSDGVMIGDRLIISAAWKPELWIFDLAVDPADPPMITAPMPSLVSSLQRFDDDELLATWVGRPVITRLADDGTILVEAGIRPDCSDTLDNDGDGLSDDLDPDCDDDLDATESGGRTARPADLAPVGGLFLADAQPCEDGIDNDRDGLTDDEDDACAISSVGETLPECGDGIDNDGDGLTDDDDESCYGTYDLSEGLGGAYGPYSAAVVDAGPYGTFVYTLDPQRSRLGAYDASGDTLVRIDLSSQLGYVAPMPYRGYVDGEGKEQPDDTFRGQRRAWRPGPADKGERDLVLPATPGLWLTAGQLRGELWERLIAPQVGEVRGSVDNGISRKDEISWAPFGCDPDISDRCYQPERDDASWYVFVPRADGSIQLVEAIRRGVPLHRFTQTTTDPSLRGTDIAKPALFLRNVQRSLGSNLREGFPFMGPLTDEQLDTSVPEAHPATFRRFGVWPPEDLICVAHACEHALRDGDPCAEDEDCGDGSYCDGDAEVPVCAADLELDGTCDRDAQCGEQLRCEAVGGGEVCVAIAKDEEAGTCTVADDCGVHQRCDGGACIDVCLDDADCDEGLHCDEAAETCLADAQLGKGCATDDDCLVSLHCDGGVCASDGLVGDACERDAECAPKLWCHDATDTCQAGCQTDADCADDPETAPSERWFVTWEGALLGTASALGRFIQQDTDTADGVVTSRRMRFYDPKVPFCDRGAEVGDWLVIEAAPMTLDPALRFEVDVVTTAGDACPTEPVESALIEAPIVEVGEREVVVEATDARLRPREPVLDEDAIEAAGLNLKDCEDALKILVGELTWETIDEDGDGDPDRLPSTSALRVENLPAYLEFTVRPRDAWTVIGSASGYLHRWSWDAGAGACVEHDGADLRFAGRITQVGLTTADEPYGSCPPGLEDIGFDDVGALLPAGWRRFTNWSFSLDMFPGCRNEEDGSITIVANSRDTTWLFDFAGPDSPQSVSVDGVLLGNRVPLLDFRRQQVQLDTATGRVHLLQIRANASTTIATFE